MTSEVDVMKFLCMAVVSALDGDWETVAQYVNTVWLPIQSKAAAKRQEREAAEKGKAPA